MHRPPCQGLRFGRSAATNKPGAWHDLAIDQGRTESCSLPAGLPPEDSRERPTAAK